jgi:TPR repeat protein
VLAETRSSLVIAAAALIVPEKLPIDPPASNVAALGPAAPSAAAPSPAARPERPAAPSPTGPQLIPEDRERVMALLARGNDQLAQGNVAAARLYYQRAADAGVAQAALALASTYDPDELIRLRVVGMQADRDLARRWYERARELGAPEAERRLKRLGAK